MNIVEVDNLSFKYETDTILEKLSFTAELGDYIGIIGVNGSGKTTLIRLILGIIPYTKGSIKINTNKISYVSQSMQNKDMTFPASVFDIVSLGIDKKVLRKSDKDTINKILKLFDIYDIKNQIISSLSGGQLQKVKIALAVVSNPDLLVLDEPTAGMDTDSEKSFINYITMINREYNTTIIFISHKLSNLSEANKLYRIANKGLEKVNATI